MGERARGGIAENERESEKERAGARKLLLRDIMNRSERKGREKGVVIVTMIILRELVRKINLFCYGKPKFTLRVKG